MRREKKKEKETRKNERRKKAKEKERDRNELIGNRPRHWQNEGLRAKKRRS